MKYLAALILAVLLAPAHAGTFYYVECGVGAGAGCVAGNNTTGDGSQGNPWKTPVGGPQPVEVNTLKLARCGAWDSWTRVHANQTTNVTSKTNPYIYDEWTPSWCSGEASGTASGSAATTITDGSKSWTTDEWVGRTVYVKRASLFANDDPNNTHVQCLVTGNTATVLTCSAGWFRADGSAGATPPTGATYTVRGAKPRINCTDTCFNLEDSGAPSYEEGFAVRNLEMVCPTGTSHGFRAVRVYNVYDWVWIEGNVIRNCKEGVDMRTSTVGSELPTHPDGASKHWHIRNNIITKNYHQGILGAAHYLQIENNWIDNNGYAGEPGTHNVYISSQGRGIWIRYNTVTRNTRCSPADTGTCTAGGGDAGYCRSVSMVSHGTHPDSVIEGNFVYEDKVGVGCYGIDFNGQSTSDTQQMDYSNLVVRGNLLVFSDTGRAPGLAIGCSSCPNALIEDNVIVSAGDSSGHLIQIPSTNIFNSVDAVPPRTNDVPDGNATVRNNSMYVSGAATTSNRRGIHFFPADFQGAGSGLSNQVYNNLIYLASTVHSAFTCFDTDGTAWASVFEGINRNVCFKEGGAPTWSDVYATLAAAQAAGFDANGSTADPLLSALPAAANYWRMATQAGSALRNAADSGNRSALGIRGVVASGGRDIGAEESDGSNAAPPAPFGRVQ